MQDIADFLRAHAPFDTLDEDTLAKVAASAEIEFHLARTPILDGTAGPAEHTYVVRRGSVECQNGREAEHLALAHQVEQAALDHQRAFVSRGVRAWQVWRGPAGLRSG